MNAMSIEMPAGLIDAGEDPQTAGEATHTHTHPRTHARTHPRTHARTHTPLQITALRELFEETGYVGEVKGSPSPPIALIAPPEPSSSRVVTHTLPPAPAP